MLTRTQLQLLQLLLQLARSDQPANLSVIATELRLSCRRADQLLSELDHLGLADAERVRLTMAGLVIAVSTPLSRSRLRRQAA